MNLIKFPNPLLTRSTLRVRREWSVEDDFAVFAPYVPEDVQGMKDLLAQIPNGLALAANQVGLRSRFFVVKPEFAQQNGLPEVVLNPEWQPNDFGESYTDGEGCLSFPGLTLDIERYWGITASFEKEDGTREEVGLTGLASRMFQHECEHLDGETFLENLPRIQRYQVAANYKKGRR